VFNSSLSFSRCGFIRLYIRFFGINVASKSFDNNDIKPFPNSNVNGNGRNQ